MQKHLFFFFLLTGLAFQGAAQGMAVRYRALLPQIALLQAQSMPIIAPATTPEDTAIEESAPLEAVAEEAFEFSTSYTGSGNLLKWDVPKEETVVNVIIEGSTDGQHFIDLESLEHAEAEAMDLFYDAAPQGRSYYRLIANYKSGRQRITQVERVAGVPEKPMSVALVTDGPDALLVESRQRIELYDMQGQLLKTADPQDGRFVLDMELLPKGQYLVRSGDDRQLIHY